jgi:hypothetical protein
MPEKIPSFESEFNPEELDLIKFLESHKGERAEAAPRIANWVDAEEARLKEIGADQRATTESNIKRAKLYRAGGFSAEAFDFLNDVRYEANQAGDLDLMQVAEDMLDEIERSGELAASDQSEKRIDESLERQRGYGDQEKP